MSIVEASYIDRLSNKKNRKVYISKTGNGFVPVYEYKIVDGIQLLVKSGERNVQDEIDSFAESTDIHVIIERLMNGDTSMLLPDGVYGDFTNVPKTYAEMFSRIQECENVFNTLPVDIRSKFDNSYRKFWSDFGSDHFNSVFEEFNSSSNDVTVVPVVDEKGVDNAE